MDLSFHVIDGVAGFHFQCDGLSSKRLDEDLHATAKSEHQMESGFFLDVVIAQCTSVFKLLTREDETLLIWRDSFLILNKCGNNLPLKL